ncbi:MAG: MarR family transcriptional regulator [Fusobacteriaceae bacterium]|jgi:DNA-binding MarR family transcriptional regulator|nr:MarR family transcriptional regulator [Fusobacteriaceae bacterium]
MKTTRLRNSLCYCINFRRAANTLTKFYDQAFIPLNLTATQFSLLKDIHFLKTCNKSELAVCAELDRTTIIRNLNVLFEKGFIEEIPSENNRNNLIQLTKIGEDIRINGLVIWDQVQKKIDQIFGDENIITLKEIFKSIKNI